MRVSVRYRTGLLGCRARAFVLTAVGTSVRRIRQDAYGWWIETLVFLKVEQGDCVHGRWLSDQVAVVDRLVVGSFSWMRRLIGSTPWPVCVTSRNSILFGRDMRNTLRENSR